MPWLSDSTPNSTAKPNGLLIASPPIKGALETSYPKILRQLSQCANWQAIFSKCTCQELRISCAPFTRPSGYKKGKSGGAGTSNK